MPYLKIAVHRRRQEIVGLLETTSRNVSNEKEFIHNSRKQCVGHEHRRGYYNKQNGKHTLED